MLFDLLENDIVISLRRIGVVLSLKFISATKCTTYFHAVNICRFHFTSLILHFIWLFHRLNIHHYFRFTRHCLYRLQKAFPCHMLLIIYFISFLSARRLGPECFDFDIFHYYICNSFHCQPPSPAWLFYIVLILLLAAGAACAMSIYFIFVIKA